jgi:hypothetical protein
VLRDGREGRRTERQEDGKAGGRRERKTERQEDEEREGLEAFTRYLRWSMRHKLYSMSCTISVTVEMTRAIETVCTSTMR